MTAEHPSDEVVGAPPHICIPSRLFKDAQGWGRLRLSCSSCENLVPAFPGWVSLQTASAPSWTTLLLHLYPQCVKHAFCSLFQAQNITESGFRYSFDVTWGEYAVATQMTKYCLLDILVPKWPSSHPTIRPPPCCLGPSFFSFKFSLLISSQGNPVPVLQCPEQFSSFLTQR